MYRKTFFGKEYSFYSDDDLYDAVLHSYDCSNAEEFESALSDAGIDYE